ANMGILAAPFDPDYVEDLGMDDYRNLIQLAKKIFDVVIIDSGTEMYALHNQAWLKLADINLVLTLPEVATLHSTKKFATYLQRHGIDNLCYVVMRADA